jgi:hypothetical protein
MRRRAVARVSLAGVVAMTDDTYSHYVRTWGSRHDNGWEAWVGEDEHGDFHAWACPSGAATVLRDAVEDTERHGKDAAFLELECMTGHRCGQNCSGWQQAAWVEA